MYKVHNRKFIPSITKIATKFNCKFYDTYTHLSNNGLFVSEAFFFLIGSIKAWFRQLTMTKSSSSQNHLHRLVNPFSTNCKFDRVNKVPFTRAPMIFMCGSACFNRVGGLLLLLLLTGSPSSWIEVTDLLSYCYHSPWSFQSLYYSWFGVRLLAKLFRKVFAIICALWVILFAGFATVCMEMKAYFPKKRPEI